MDGVPLYTHTTTTTTKNRQKREGIYKLIFDMRAVKCIYTAHWHGPTHWKDAQGPATSQW